MVPGALGRPRAAASLQRPHHSPVSCPTRPHLGRASLGQDPSSPPASLVKDRVFNARLDRNLDVDLGCVRSVSESGAEVLEPDSEAGCLAAWSASAGFAASEGKGAGEGDWPRLARGRARPGVAAQATPQATGLRRPWASCSEVFLGGRAACQSQGASQESWWCVSGSFCCS